MTGTAPMVDGPGEVPAADDQVALVSILILVNLILIWHCARRIGGTLI